MLPFILAFIEIGPNEIVSVGEEGKCSAHFLANIYSNVQTGDWTTNDLNSIVNEVSSKFSIDASSLANYFKVVRYSNNAKRAFSTFGFVTNSLAYRDTFLSTTIIKVSRNNGVFTVNGRQASTKGEAGIQYFDEICFDSKQYFDLKTINAYYSTMESIISDEIESFKQI